MKKYDAAANKTRVLELVAFRAAFDTSAFAFARI